MSVTTIRTKETPIAVPIDICLNHLYDEYDEPVANVAVLKTIMTAVVNQPDNPRVRNLNAEKVMPLVTQPNLAPWYILRHAGFAKVGPRILLPEGEAATAQLTEVLTLFNEFVNSKEERLRAKMASDSEMEARIAQRRAEREAREAEAKRAREAELAAQRAEEEAIQAEADRRLAEWKEGQITSKLAEQAKRREARRLRREQLAAVKAAPTEDAMTTTPAGATEAEDETTKSSGEEKMGLGPESTATATALDADLEDTPDEDEDDAKLRGKLQSMTDAELNEFETDTLGVSATHEPDEAFDAAYLESLGLPAGSRPPKHQGAANEKPLSEMTYDEKMAWLERRKQENKIRKEKEAIQKEKERERSRRELGRAALDLQEQLEEARRRDAIAQRRKEDAAKRAAAERARKIAQEDQARRKREAEERQRELERIRAEKEKAGR